MYRFLFFGIIVFCLLGGLYWLTGRFFSIYGIEVKQWRSRCLRIIITIIFGVLCFRWSIFSIISIHLICVVAILEMLVLCVRRIWKCRESRKCYRFLHLLYHSGIVPILIVGLFFGYGYYNIGHLVKTEYTVTSDKLSMDYTIILITDIHYGTIQNPEVIKDNIKEINALQPDLVVLCGDIVEEGTSNAAMKEAFEVLGSMESQYGIYYVYGNHDRQPYTSNRAYTEDELEQTIQANGITILRDECITINQDLILAGREDAFFRFGRASSEELLKNVDQSHYIIMLDHQPVEIEENAKQGVDLELSGHTHAGQIFPVGYFSEWLGILNYGEYQRNGCKVIVSSGAAGWGYPIRTQERCEYVVIHLKRM